MPDAHWLRLILVRAHRRGTRLISEASSSTALGAVGRARTLQSQDRVYPSAAKNAVVVFESGLSPSLKLACVRMVLFGDAEGYRIYPSMHRLARELGCTKRSAQQRIRKLRDMGILIPLRSRAFTRALRARGPTGSASDGRGARRSHPAPRRA
jgi:hypothetical protein